MNRSNASRSSGSPATVRTCDAATCGDGAAFGGEGIGSGARDDSDVPPDPAAGDGASVVGDDSRDGTESAAGAPRGSFRSPQADAVSNVAATTAYRLQRVVGPVPIAEGSPTRVTATSRGLAVP